MKRALLALVLSVPLGAIAQTTTSYVWSAAPSTPHDGSDWNHAYTSLPSSLVRGCIYYVGAGNYPARNFSDPESGTTKIWIRKATPTDHGTDVGWSATAGGGQALFTGQISISRDYYVFDGSYRDESNPPYSWTNGVKYGFRVLTTGTGGGNETSLDLNANNWPPGADNCKFSYMCLGGPEGSTYPSAPGHAVYCPGGGDNFTFDHDAFLNTWVPFLGHDNANMVFVYDVVAWSYSKEGFMSYETMTPHGGDNALIRSNLFLNTGIQPNAEGPTAIIGNFDLVPNGVGDTGWDVQWNVLARESGVAMQNLNSGSILLGDILHSTPFYMTNCIAANNAKYNLPGDANIYVHGASNTVLNNGTYSSFAAAVNAVFPTLPRPTPPTGLNVAGGQ